MSLSESHGRKTSLEMILSGEPARIIYSLPAGITTLLIQSVYPTVANQDQY